MDDPSEVVVIADQPHRASNGRIDQATREPRRTQGSTDRQRQQRADRDGAARLAICVAELAVGAKATVGAVDSLQHIRNRAPRRVQVAGLDQDMDARPQGVPAGTLRHV